MLPGQSGVCRDQGRLLGDKRKHFAKHSKILYCGSHSWCSHYAWEYEEIRSRLFSCLSKWAWMRTPNRLLYEILDAMYRSIARYGVSNDIAIFLTLRCWRYLLHAPVILSVEWFFQTFLALFVVVGVMSESREEAQKPPPVPQLQKPEKNLKRVWKSLYAPPLPVCLPSCLLAQSFGTLFLPLSHLALHCLHLPPPLTLSSWMTSFLMASHLNYSLLVFILVFFSYFFCFFFCSALVFSSLSSPSLKGKLLD